MRTRGWWVLGWPLPLALLVVLLTAGRATAHPMERMDYWQRHYAELVPAADPRAARAHAIFTQVVQVAGKRPGVVPRLFIAREEPVSLALPLALPDGGVILSKRVLDLCYRDPARGDDRLAFVLAHELAHLLKDDYWHMQFFQALAAAKSQGAPVTHDEVTRVRRLAQDPEQIWSKELQADEQGILYASLAGFRTQAVVSDDETVNFFAEWVRALDPQQLSKASGTHPSPPRRAQVVKDRLRQVLDNLELFHLGLRFYHTARYERAVRAFQAFVTIFPSREVYHNLAASHHQMALHYQRLRTPDDPALPFHLSLAVDPVTRAGRLVDRGADGRAPQTPAALFAEHLTHAIAHYQTALSLDPTYAPSHTNLGGALLLQGDVFKAIGTLQDALKVAPEAPETLNNLGVAFAQAEHGPRALEYLQKAHALAPTYEAPLFNLGKLAYEAGQPAEAQRYWQAYGQLAAAGPWLEVLRRKVPALSVPAAPPAPTPPTPERLLGVGVGYFTDELPPALGSPRELRFALEQDPLILARYPAGVMTLSQDNEMLLVGTLDTYQGTSARGIAIGSSAQELLARYGRPSQVLRTAREESWRYDTAGIAFQLRAGQVVAWLLF